MAREPTDRLGDCFHRELPDFLFRDSDEALFADRFNAKHPCEPVSTSPSAEQPI